MVKKEADASNTANGETHLISDRLDGIKPNSHAKLWGSFYRIQGLDKLDELDEPLKRVLLSRT